jgi:hypothetical protein
MDNTAPTAGITNNTISTELTCSRTTISVTATGGVSYAWSGSLGSNAAASISAPGTYTVTVTGANGCSTTSSITITQDIATPGASIANNNGLALSCSIPSTTLTASGNGSYAWSTSATSAAITVTTAGTYTVTVTGTNGCTSTAAVATTMDNTAPTAGITNNEGTTELTCTTTSISVTATGGASYAWSGSLGNNASASITTPGTYTVTVTGANGCTSTSAITITQDIAAPGASIANNNGLALSCSIPSTTLTASGNGTFTWSTSATTAAITVSSAGTYTVTVTGTNGCTSTAAVTTTMNNTAPTAGITNNTGSSELTCTITSISVIATGGASYTWSGGLGSNAAALITSAGTYTVTVTGNNGCKSTSSIVVTESTGLPSVSILNNTGTSVLNCNTTSISLTATGGASYSWNNSMGTNATISVTQPGTYVVTVTSVNGCQSSSSIVITQDIAVPTAGIVNNTGSTELNCLHGSISLTATGGSSYSWSNGTGVVGGAAAISISSPGTYTVTVSNANGCSTTSSIHISQDFTIPVIATQPSKIARKVTLNLIPVAYNVTVSGTGNFNYQWYRNTTDANVGGEAIAGANASSYVPSTAVASTYYYYVVVSNNSGCTVTSDVTGYITVCGP